MKSLFLALLLAGTIAAQESSNTPNDPLVAVVQSGWRMEMAKRPRPAALDVDPLAPAREAIQLDREKKETMRSNGVLQKLGQDQQPLPTQASSTPGPAIPPMSSASGPYRSNYIYQVKLANQGTKRIRSIDWEYVFFEPNPEHEVGRHPFTNKVTIPPGKTRELVGHSTSAPAPVVDVNKSGEAGKGQYTERIVIRRIEYTDGSVWTHN